jgi:hypothetical protein
MSSELSVIGQVKGFWAKDSAKKRFQRVLEQKIRQYMASIINIVCSSMKFQMMYIGFVYSENEEEGIYKDNTQEQEIVPNLLAEAESEEATNDIRE